MTHDEHRRLVALQIADIVAWAGLTRDEAAQAMLDELAGIDRYDADLAAVRGLCPAPSGPAEELAAMDIDADDLEHARDLALLARGAL